MGFAFSEMGEPLQEVGYDVVAFLLYRVAVVTLAAGFRIVCKGSLGKSEEIS